MQPLRQWLRPPRTLLLILFLLALVSISALAWFGWRLGQQEQLVEAQRSQDRLEQSADRISATSRSALAETGEQLRNPDAKTVPNGGLLLVISESGITAT